MIVVPVSEMKLKASKPFWEHFHKQEDLSWNDSEKSLGILGQDLQITA